MTGMVWLVSSDKLNTPFSGEQAFQAALVVQWGKKKGELTVISQEFESLNWKSQCKMLIGTDEFGNDFSTVPFSCPARAPQG